MMDFILGAMVLGWPLVALGLFALLGVIVVVIAWRLGRSEGRRWGRWMAGGFLLFAFWDTPLVLGHFTYGCWADGGFRKYKSVEQWKAENPGVAETLQHVPMREWIVLNKPPMNQRFEYHSKETRYLTGVVREEDWILDIEENEVMARYVDYRTFERSNELKLASPRTYKFWLNRKSCEPQDRTERIQFNGYVNAMSKIGR